MQNASLQNADMTLPSEHDAEIEVSSGKATSDDMIYCSRCGEKNHENNYQCTRCGFVLHALSASQVPVSNEDTMFGLIPVKNMQALIAYYLAVFSLIPVLGIPLGITALVLGIRGLGYAKAHPEAKGAIHAWIGIALGGFSAVAYLSLIAIPVFQYLKN